MKAEIKKVVAFSALLLFFFIGYFKATYIEGKKKLSLEERADKNALIINVFSLWMKQNQKGKSIASFLEKNEFNHVAIYGMHYLGKQLLSELRESAIEVRYAIDINAENINADVLVIHPNTEMRDVDAVIVTPVHGFEVIKGELEKKLKCPILLLNDILLEM